MMPQEAVRGPARSAALARTGVAAARTRRLGRTIGVYGAAALLALWTALPLYWLVNMSLMFKAEFVTVPAHLYPHDPTITTYLRIFDLPAYDLSGERMYPVGEGFLVRKTWVNSLLVALPVTVLTMLIALPIAYAMGRLDFRYKTGMLFGLLSTRSYPPVATLIPFSALFFSIGLQSTRTGLIIIYLTLTIPLVSWIMSGFFAALPRNIEQAARIDGLTRFGALWRVLIPLAMPGVAACAVISFLTCWNEFFFALVLTSGSLVQTYPVTLSGMQVMVSVPHEVAAVAVLGLIPPTALAFIFQRRIRNLNIVNPF
jgi:multiple sugar transport system permease protein